MIQSFHGFSESVDCIFVELLFSSFFFLSLNFVLLFFDNGKLIWFTLVLFCLLFKNLKIFKFSSFLFKLSLYLGLVFFGLMLFFVFLCFLHFVSLEFHLILHVFFITGFIIASLVGCIGLLVLRVGFEGLGLLGGIIELIDTFHIVNI